MNSNTYLKGLFLAFYLCHPSHPILSEITDLPKGNSLPEISTQGALRYDKAMMKDEGRMTSVQELNNASRQNIRNPSADEALKYWSIHGSPIIFEDAGGNPTFVLRRDEDYLSQDIKIPIGTHAIHLKARTRSVWNRARGGYPYLQMILQDENNETLQDIKTPYSTSMYWISLACDIVQVPPSAQTLRIKLRRTHHPFSHDWNWTYFDDLSLKFE